MRDRFMSCWNSQNKISLSPNALVRIMFGTQSSMELLEYCSPSSAFHNSSGWDYKRWFMRSSDWRCFGRRWQIIWRVGSISKRCRWLSRRRSSAVSKPHVSKAIFVIKSILVLGGFDTPLKKHSGLLNHRYISATSFKSLRMS